MTNARFWTVVNDSPVKITLHQGQSLSWCGYWRTDEGFSSEGIEWNLDGETVTCNTWSNGRDCDGRLSTECLTYCQVDKLRSRFPFDAQWDGTPDPWQGIPFPEWELESRSQRDYSAEAMGY